MCEGPTILNVYINQPLYRIPQFHAMILELGHSLPIPLFRYTKSSGFENYKRILNPSIL